MKRNFITGFVSGAVVFSMAGALAAGLVANPNTFPIKLDGKDVSIEGYNVEDYTYFKLRDIADAVGGFDVDFEDDTIVLTSQNKETSALSIKEEGMFSSGGTVTDPVAGEFDAATNWLDSTRAGNTAHVDHANVLFQIPETETGLPMVFLHGYGQSRMGWMTTPDGREGWSTMFLKKGHSVFLVDQPRRGEAGSTAAMTNDSLDTWSEDSKEYKPGDQAWYTHFRIGRGTPNRYDGSQFPAGDEAQNQFLRQMTPNTGGFDLAVNKAALDEVLSDVKDKTGKKSIYVTHSQGCSVGFAVDTENVAALVAIEPGSAPAVGSEQYNKLLEAKIPVVFYYGDYIDNGPEDIASTAFWKGARDSAVAFAEGYNAAGGNCTVVNLPDEGITGNSHFLFQELNNAQIADHLENWIKENVK
ncbi:MAG: alpha/beta fold hydrolase [Candidatus Ornithomonoglobus sp.]